MFGKDDKKIEEDTSKIKEIGSTTHFQCSMLKGANYTTWAIRMQVILEANELWEMIEPNLTTEVDTKKDKTAIAYIYQSLPEEQLLLISKYKTAKEVWDALKTRHVGVNRVQQAKQQTLKSEFEMLQMKEFICYKVDGFLQIVASIEQYSDLDTMSLDEAIGRLKTFEERLKYKNERPVNTQEGLLFTRHEDQGQQFRRRGHGFMIDHNNEGGSNQKNMINLDLRKITAVKVEVTEEKLIYLDVRMITSTTRNQSSSSSNGGFNQKMDQEDLKTYDKAIAIKEENVGLIPICWRQRQLQNSYS
ncbi:zinc finger, CCHC-type containing protein [Tanacetum coccineum]